MSQNTTPGAGLDTPACTPVQTAETGLLARPADCAHCSTPLKGGLKYEGVCTTCDPIYLQRCGGCQRQLWSCMCVRPHTWE